MKKAFLGSIVAGVMAFTFSAGAVAVSANVSTISAEQSGVKVSFSGTAETGVLAVTCGLIDVNGNEKAINSVAVNNSGKFEGSFTIGGSEEVKTIRCANYDGGDWATATIVVNEPFIPKAPDTGIVR